MLSFIQYDTPVLVIGKLLEYLKINAAPKTIKNHLENHPDYPSLISYSDTLKALRVEHAAIQVTDKNKIDEIPIPFITKINSNNQFITVTAINGQQIGYYADNKQIQWVAKKDFVNEWSGTILVAEATAHSGDANYAQEIKKEKQQALLPFIAITTGLLLIAAATFGLWLKDFTYFSIIIVAVFMLSLLAGISVTTILLWYEVDKYNPGVKQFCKSNSPVVNCNAVLNSSQAKLFKKFSWGEIGFYYFTGSFIFLVIAFITGSVEAINYIVWLAIAALPYTIFSVYYQWKVVKQWCMLCLTVQSLLLVGAVLVFAGGFLQMPLLNYPLVCLFALSFSVPLAIWNFAKPRWLAAIAAKKNHTKYLRLKFDTQVFNALLQQQKQITLSTEGLGITIGNPQASNTIVKVCNPYCGPCATAHKEIETLLEENADVKVQIIFTATNNEGDIKLPPVKHLMAIANTANTNTIKQSLDDWYLAENKDYTAFSVKYPLQKEILENASVQIAAMDNWCKETSISFTPTIFINGYQLPNSYSIADLKYFMD